MWQYTQRFLFSLVLSFFFFSSPFFFFVCCFFSRCNCWNWQYSIWLIGHVFLLFFFVLCWESPTSIDVRKSLRLESENWRQNCFFFCALFSAFFLLLTLICIIYRVLTDRWALLLMVLRIFVKTHKQTGAHSNTKKKKKQWFDWELSVVATASLHSTDMLTTTKKKWLSFYRFFLSLSVELRLILLFYVLNMGEKKKKWE